MTGKPEKRPKIETLSKDKISLSAEEFQNQTLRPILKMKNEILLAFFKSHIEKKKIKWSGINKEKKETFIYDSLNKDHNFKNAIIHLIAGNFTIEEYHLYAKNQKENNKRIWKMFQQRIFSQLI